MIDLNKTFSCPFCNNERTNFQSTETLLSDVRLDILECPLCGTVFAVYSKASEATVRVMQTAPVVDPDSPLSEVNEAHE